MFDATKGFIGDPLDLIDRIVLSPEGVTLSVSLVKLTGSDLPSLDHTVAMQMKRRGVEMRLVIEGSGPATPKADPALVKAIARAHRWFDDLLNGRASSLTEIAERENITRRYVSHLMPLAFLAPDIIEAIITGNHPVELTAESLIKRTDLPLAWNQQRELLGIVAQTHSQTLVIFKGSCDTLAEASAF